MAPRLPAKAKANAAAVALATATASAGAQRGERFVLDVTVVEVLLTPTATRRTRLFTMRLPSIAALQAFFADPAHLEIRHRLFEPTAVASAGPRCPTHAFGGKLSIVRVLDKPPGMDRLP